jgi:hypothetical protein
MGILHVINKGKMMKNLEKFHIYNDKNGNQINDKYTVRPYIIFDKLIPKYTSTGQSLLTLQLPTVTSLSHNLQHSQSARLLVASQLHNKTVIIPTGSPTSYLYCNSTFNYTNYLSL